MANVRIDAIVGTTHPSYYGLNWLQMLVSLERHKDDIDVTKVKEAIINTKSCEVTEFVYSSPTMV